VVAESLVSESGHGDREVTGRSGQQPDRVLQLSELGFDPIARGGLGGNRVAPGRSISADRRIRKLSLDSTLSGRPELYCEAQLSALAPRSLHSDRTQRKITSKKLAKGDRSAISFGEGLSGVA